MKKGQEHAADAANDASTSRARRFLRAWKHASLEKYTPMEHLEVALKAYELLTVMRDWDPREKPLALHEEFDASIIEGLETPHHYPDKSL